jgi:hypothetical protein
MPIPIPPNHIRVWRWEDAPEELKALSTHGGDEDWVALLPPKFAGEWIGWMEGGSFGACDTSVHTHPELPGYEVRIGAHA